MTDNNFKNLVLDNNGIYCEGEKSVYTHINIHNLKYIDTILNFFETNKCENIKISKMSGETNSLYYKCKDSDKIFGIGWFPSFDYKCTKDNILDHKYNCFTKDQANINYQININCNDKK